MESSAEEADLGMNLPNRLTLARMVMAPVFVALMSFHTILTYVLAYAVFTAAIITDYYDGKIARERNLVTNFGKLWDPVADKVIMAAAFVMLMQVPELRVPGWTVVAILGREFAVTGARSFAASGGLIIGANEWGKAKTVVQMVYVMVFLFLATLGQVMVRVVPHFASRYYLPYLEGASLIGIVGVALFTLYTGVQFARINWRSLGLGKL